MLPQTLLRCRGFDHCTVGREVAAQHRKAAAFHERLVARQNHVTIEHFRARDVLAERASVDGALAERQQIRNLREQRAQPARVEKILHQELAGGPNVGDQGRSLR